MARDKVSSREGVSAHARVLPPVGSWLTNSESLQTFDVAVSGQDGTSRFAGPLK